MKKTKCILPVLLAVLLIVLAPINTFAATKNVSVKASCGSVYVGSAKKIKVTATKGAKITYKALNSCVSVDSKGNVKGKKVGTGKVCLTASKKGYKTVKKTISVKIIKRNQKITAKNVTVNVGKTASLGASAKTGLKFKSSNNAVATVNSKGVVKGIRKGTAVITVQSGAKKLTCKVTVK